MRLDIRRGGDALRIEVLPDAQPSDRPEEAGRTVGRIGAGVSSRVEMVEVRYGPLESLQRSVGHTWDMSIFSLRMLGKMLVGELSWRNLSGPVAIADYAGQSARVGWHAYLGFLALISISLGVLNLLPIPVLDGGHLVYYGLEAVRGRPLSERFLEVTQKAGLVIIAAMMIMALFNDLTRLIG
jgi:regulator of sigma E protease